MNIKVAVASDDGEIISPHFGRTRGFVVFEIEGTEIRSRQYRPNTFTGHAQGLGGGFHGHDKHTAIINALKDCKTVISNGMGRRIYNDLRSAGIEAYITQETSVTDAVTLYIKGELIDQPDRSCEHGDKECSH